MDTRQWPATKRDLTTAPAAPHVGGARLMDSVDELVRFVIASGEFVDLGLSADYRARLLEPENGERQHAITVPSDHSTRVESTRGVPICPLYKHLAKNMGQSIEHGRIFRSPELAEKVPAEEHNGVREIELEKLIVDKGMELTAMFDAVDFELHVQEPYFSLLKAGTKVVEGRLATGDFNRIEPRSVLLFNKSLMLHVERVTKYSSFAQMLEAETLPSVLPGIATIEEGVDVYRKFYTEEKEKAHGVLAIAVSKPTSQPYISMKELICGLGYDGLGRLLGMACTLGTVPDGLPPQRSNLVNSSMNIYNPDGTSSLTDAARALAKHVERSRDGWWGEFTGDDFNKNHIASLVVDRMLNECSWMNVHMTQSHGSVFEIRLPEGYGARWTKDGSKFIGFLEPYTKEGFSNRWRH